MSSSISSTGTSISGLASGIDWQNIVTQLRAVEENKVTRLENKQSTLKEELSAWQDLQDLLQDMQDVSSDLTAGDSFDLYLANLTTTSTTVDVDDILTASASTSASKGTYEVVVGSVAQVEKLGSQSYTSKTTALGVNGTIVVNGIAVSIESADTLSDIGTRINAVNTGDDPSGVVASILQESDNSYKLVLTSEETGADGISLLNGSGTDTLGTLGFNSSGTQIKNAIVGGARSDAFSSSSTSVESLLGNESEDLSGSVLINGTAVSIDLSDSLETIRDNMVAAGLSATIVTERNDESETIYRLQIENMTDWSDNSASDGIDDTNVLQALGLIEGKREATVGTTGGTANTTDGSAAIKNSTLLTDIYGYADYTSGDAIAISGTTHDGTAVDAASLPITETTTVGDLLDRIESLFGDVTASVTADGRIRIVDNTTGNSSLSITLDTEVANGTLGFGTFASAGTVQNSVIQAGKDASFTVDGVAMTSSSNSVTTAISGVTLKLSGADPDTTVTVSIDTDASSIEDKVQNMLDAYNKVISYINDQMTYNADTKETGGPLFGDNQLKDIKNNLQSAILSKMNGSTYNYLSQIGLNIEDDNTLSLDTDEFEEALATNLNDVINLFANTGTGSSTSLAYLYSSTSTKSGTYDVSIDEGGTCTIDGTTATGANGIYSVSDSGSDAYGLQIRYTGSGAFTGTFTFNRGIASIVDRLLDSMTDSLNGTVTAEENSIQDGIDTLDEKISDTEELIDSKMNTLTAKFQSMEIALASLSSTSSYLSSL